MLQGKLSVRAVLSRKSFLNQNKPTSLFPQGSVLCLSLCFSSFFFLHILVYNVTIEMRCVLETNNLTTNSSSQSANALSLKVFRAIRINSDQFTNTKISITLSQPFSFLENAFKVNVVSNVA